MVGLVVNKFRGDVDILKPGLTMLEQKTGVPVLGVIPYTRADIDDEDSLSQRLEQTGGHKPVDITILRLPRISNFTDFAPLERHHALGVRYVTTVQELGHPDLVILPGTKNTMGDLLWMRQNGLEAGVKQLAAGGVPVLGVCGGYQMLGKKLCDPEGVEHGGELEGLGLLPCETLFSRQKVRTRVEGEVIFSPLAGAKLEGYEIHMGRTQASCPPFCTLADGQPEGAAQGGVFGTYLHGLFDSGELVTRLANWLLSRQGKAPEEVAVESHQDYEQRQFDLLAEEVRRSLDLEAVYRAMEAYQHG